MDNVLRDLYQHIVKIKQKEQHEKKMICYIEAHLEKLHKSVSINSATPAETLYEFTFAYIESAPDYLDAIQTLAVESKTYAYVKPFIGLAFMFFIKPPELILQHPAAQRLLYQSYLSNRLLEELNDQIMSISSTPLTPMDIGMDNIVCHAIIGDEIANQLDHLVLLALETTIADKTVFEQPETQVFLERIRKDNWKGVKERWPCFSNDLSANLLIGDYSSSIH